VSFGAAETTRFTKSGFGSPLSSGGLRWITTVAALSDLHGSSYALWPRVQLKPFSSVTSPPFETTSFTNPLESVSFGEGARIIRVPMNTL